FAAAIAVQHNIFIEQRDERCRVPATRRFCKLSQQRAMALAVDGKARLLLEYARTVAAEDLAAGDSVAPNPPRDPLARKIGRVVQCGAVALWRGEGLDNGKKCDADVLGAYARRIFG